MKLLPIFLLFCFLLMGCSAPEQSTETPKTTPLQIPIPETQTQTPAIPSQTTPISGSTEDLGINDIEEDLKEMEDILSELESLENMSFEI
ncbi:MAG: hypothetical protein QXU31_07550 [Archaeoglobaceae archaeon]